MVIGVNDLLRPIRTVAPASPPVSVAEAKAQLGNPTGDDALITSLIEAATGYFDGWEGILGRCLVTQTWALKLGSFPASSELPLPFPNVSSVVVTYFDAANTSQTFADTNYYLVQANGGAAIVLRSSVSWPTLYDRPEAVTVTMVAGYGVAASVPAPIRQAIILRTRSLYTAAKRDPSLRREMVDGVGSLDYDVSGTSQEALGKVEESLVAPYRWIHF